MKKLISIVAFLAVAAATAIYAADATSVHGISYVGNRDIAAVDAVAGLDSSDYAELPTPTKERKTVMVSPFLSNGGATCKVALALGTYDGTTFKVMAWVETGTLTASSTFKQTTGGFYVVPSAELLTGSWPYFKVYVTVLSAGTGSLNWRAY